MKSLFVCAGDPSGDGHASRLVRELKQRDPDLHVWGLGGPKLEAEGAELLYNSQDFAVIGIFNVINKLPMFAKIRAHLLQEVEKRQPDAILLVDFGGFNLNFASSVKKRVAKTPIIYFISPQVWGSRPWRANVIADTVSKMLTIFPFEETLYKEKGVDATFVGHPLTERYHNVDFEALRADFCTKYKLNVDRPIVGIFPGSRASEVRNFMPILLQAISWLHAEKPEIQFVISQASSRLAESIYDQINERNLTRLLDTTLKLAPAEDNLGLMASSDILWTKSGTTTLEAAFMERPMLVFYKGDWLSFTFFLMFKTVKYISWPNLLAGRMLVPELIQLDCRAEELVRYTRDWLDVPGIRTEISQELKRIKSYLRKGDFVANAAAEVAKILDLRVPQLEDASKT